ncbi:topoisomerase [Streptomyces luteireticuli]|uniref:Topoisomerase n=1 Tax=Streptomyces luteireticuli TaxID=173858 RepID=A0ABN0YRB8_9ACTN
MQSELLKADLVEAAKRYSSRYEESPAELYVVQRGLGHMANRFRLGYVSSPIAGHEQYRGRLAIPYLRPAGGIRSVATIRFRCIADTCIKAPDGSFLPPERETHDGHAKYLSLPGHSPRLYNTWALIRPSPYIVVGEGEFDPMASESADVPAIGPPGVATWRDHFAPALAGYEVVFSIGDGDPAGRKFNEEMASRLPNVKPIDLGDGYDINRYVQEHGCEAFRTKLGV